MGVSEKRRLDLISLFYAHGDRIDHGGRIGYTIQDQDFSAEILDRAKAIEMILIGKGVEIYFSGQHSFPHDIFHLADDPDIRRLGMGDLRDTDQEDKQVQAG